MRTLVISTERKLFKKKKLILNRYNHEGDLTFSTTDLFWTDLTLITEICNNIYWAHFKQGYALEDIKLDISVPRKMRKEIVSAMLNYYGIIWKGEYVDDRVEGN